MNNASMNVSAKRHKVINRSRGVTIVNEALINKKKEKTRISLEEWEVRVKLIKTLEDWKVFNSKYEEY